MESSDQTLIVLTGPTAVGKTEFSLSLAESLGCPIINADSRQIYKGIEIGTAAPTKEEMERVKHYFVHTKNLDEYYSAAQFEDDVMKLLCHSTDGMKEDGGLFANHNTLIMSGGSMMYIDAVCKGIDEIPTVDDETRQTIKLRYENEGLEPLLEELKLLDPEYYDLVDQKNHKRVVHALEICYMTGQTYTSLRTNTKKERPFKIKKIGLWRERQDLFDRINRRVDVMMQQGFMEEAKSVYHLRHLNSLNTVGYKELFNVISGEWELPMAVERIKKNTRVYAKKQMTWFKKDEDVEWLEAEGLTKIPLLD